jgi:glycosyltransferase 2 family protein
MASSRDFLRRGVVRGRRHARFALLVAVAGALSLGASFGVAWAAGFGAVFERLRDIHGWWFAAALGAEAVAYLGYMLAYREVARVEGGPQLEMPRIAALVSAGFGVFVPRGGFSADLDAFRNAGLGPREARARVLGLGALEYAILGPAAAISAAVLLEHGAHTPGPAFTWPWAIAVPVGFVAAFLALEARSWFHRKGGWRTAVGHGLDAVYVLRQLIRAPRDHGAAALAGIAGYWAADIFCLWASLQAFHVSLSVPALIVGYATGYALTRRTLPLAGAGAVEALLPFALGWSGVALAAALLAVLGYRIFNLWLPLLPAALGLPHVRRIGDIPA